MDDKHIVAQLSASHTRVVRNDTLLQTTSDSTRTRYKMAARTLLMLSAASTTVTALQVPARRAWVGRAEDAALRGGRGAHCRPPRKKPRLSARATTWPRSIGSARPAEPSNNIIASPFDAEPNAFDAMIDEAAEEGEDGPRRRRRGGGAAGGGGTARTKLRPTPSRRFKKVSRRKLDTTMEAIEAAAVPMEEIVVGPVGEFLIKWGFKDDPRIPEDERIRHAAHQR